MSHQELPFILIVDDEPGVRTILRRVAEREGYEVIEASSGTEGLALLDEWADSLALIFLDLRMPELDGFMFRAAQLKSPSAARVPTIVLSGQMVSSEDVGRLRPVACVPKPAALAELQGAIRSHARTPPACVSHVVYETHAVA